MLSLFSMWRPTKKTVFSPSLAVSGLLLVFAVAVLGCGSGMMPSMSAMHGEDMKCSGMFTSTFVISHKEVGAMQTLALLFAASALLILGSMSLLQLLVSQQRFIHILLRARSKPLRLHDHILQLFAQGILHPQIY